MPQACAALWAPYQVTKVPPPDILQQEHVPPAPPVVNRTNGAVSDADAQAWANASNNGSGWYQWAEANDQLAFLAHLVGPAVIGSSDEQQALSQGGTISQPGCNLYPISNTLFPEGAEGRAYFGKKHLPTDDQYVFVVVYRGPCVEEIHYPDGHLQTIIRFATPATVFVPGTLRHEAALGDIWFTDAGGNCQDPVGPPLAWCER